MRYPLGVDLLTGFVAEIQAEVIRQEQQALLDEYRQMLVNEQVMRQQFKEKALELVYFGRRLSALLKHKQALRQALEPLRRTPGFGNIPDIGNTDLPPLSRFWMYDEEGVRHAINELSLA